MASANKKIKLVVSDPFTEGVGVSINWDLCILCQKETNVKLQCPNNSKRGDAGAGYKTFASNYMAFKAVNAVPDWVRLTFDDSIDFVDTMIHNNAKWHKACRDQLNSTKLMRVEKKICKAELQDSFVELSEESNAVPSFSCNTRSSFSTNSDLQANCCFFCDKPAAFDADLHAVQTKNVDERVRHCAHTLLDERLIAKLSAGDMMAREAKYHAKCLAALYNKMRETNASNLFEGHNDCNTFNSQASRMHSIAFAQLVAYIEDAKYDSVTLPIFQLSQLGDMYAKKLVELGVDVTSRINTTKLKIRLMSHFPDMRAQQNGKQVLLVFDEHIGIALSAACQQTYDEESLCLAKAASIVRREMFSGICSFNGSFDMGCQENALPPNLLLLVNMILQGPSIDSTSNAKSLQAALSVSQIIKFNSVKHTRSVTGTGNHFRHNVAQETPLPLYISLLLHGTERSRNLIDKLFSLGLCVSYDRLLQVSTALGNSVSEAFDLTSGPCPSGLCKGLFTTAAVDNIDHNPSSNTSTDSFHGTAISLTQHSSTNIHARHASQEKLDMSDCKILKPLPLTYTSVLPAFFTKKHPDIPHLDFPFSAPTSMHSGNLHGEENWLEQVFCNHTNESGIDKLTDISWAAFHASSNTQVRYNFTNSRLLPLFREAAHTVAMIKHAMLVIKSVTDVQNQGQVPVMAVDQPLFAIAKRIQWQWPDKYGESKFVVLLGGLHIELAALKVLGDWLDGSGWTNVLIRAGFSSGVAESYLHASHIKRTRHVHEVTAASLYLLQKIAYDDYSNNCDVNNNVLDFKSWCSDMSNKHPQFQYWEITLQLELLVLQFIRAVRLADFDLYVESLTHLVPWFFILNHTNYARWVSVHLRDLLSLPQLNPDVYCEFKLGKFVANKTQNSFSAIALDQVHEQLNAVVKTNGGAIGLTENPAALLRWMVSGPEVATVISQFEAILCPTSKPHLNQHHEQSTTFQSSFVKQVNDVLSVFMERGNPFSESGHELYSVDTMIVVEPNVSVNLKNVARAGCDQFNAFVNERLIAGTKPLDDPITRNHLAPFHHPSKKIRKDSKITLLKSDCALFSRLYFGCQSRGGDLDAFFSHENQPFPPSLSENGQLRFGKKSDLLTCIENDSVTSLSRPSVQGIVLDGAVAVQMLSPAKGSTFLGYAHDIFVPFILSQLFGVCRLDIVWDAYLQDSLKTATRNKRGAGCRQLVLPNTQVPRNWQDFLHVNENKSELFAFLSNYVIQSLSAQSKLVIATNGGHVLSSKECPNTELLAPCNHEEADTRMLLHVLHASQCGLRKIMIRTVDTDVVVISVCKWEFLHLDELWIQFGIGDKVRYIAIHEIVTSLGLDVCRALPFFHSLTGCDTNSSFVGHGKKGAWEAWKALPEVTKPFHVLSNHPSVESVNECMDAIERFIIIMYDRTSDEQSVNCVRKYLFTKRNRQMPNLPPSLAALKEHVKRACYQAGHCWASALQANQNLPSPSQWGWQKIDDKWEPLWTTLPPVSAVCPELISCRCQKGCTARCTCRKACLPCTVLCLCDGKCTE